ncbi:peptidoglycan DD-metalloendopeptidase family protein [Rivularia sp. UHCC 0363]|uniref:peptidoglycan DD-metalloendopeptidase family protein n=1 Tax=Rivularia sp. UHCC 0363 TaxID=3110244 RepID=UPI002B1EB8AE|nr:peptidoglycan DD-metalloendopeptidase family protein [Rivularia sp. UHCC 0363]MEA5597993.1 peptidoglycan DD-metalloendopeptidase family protein [Rivularia sp. UHCC 0363]
MKAVLESAINNSDASMDRSNLVTPQIKRRMPKAAMVGLAISMGATSLFVTRQSDQAHAAEPVGNQNTASTIIPAATDEIKFAPTHKQSFNAISNDIGARIPAVVEPTAISPVKGLGAKWEVASRLKSARFATQTPVESVTAANNNTIYSTPQVVEAQVFPKASTTASRVSSNFTNSTKSLGASEAVATSATAELEAQQKFALDRLKQKSNRLKASLNKLRSTPVEDVKQVALTTQSATQVEEISTTSTDLTASQNKLVSELKPQTTVVQSQQAVTVPTPVVPTLAAPNTIAAAHLVKPGDTLAKIASNYGTSVSQLTKTNHLSNPNQLKVAQKLIVPAQNNSGRVAINQLNQTSPTEEAVTIDSSEKNLNSFGVGGDTPVPTVFTEMQLADRRNALASKVSRNDRLRSLKEEIERLRQKYRTQQSGIVVPQIDRNTNSVSVPVNRPESASIPIPITRSTIGKSSVPIRVARPNTASVPIQVPTPNQDINPNFSRDRGIRVATPPASFNDRSQSSSVVRTTVSPQLPPLAAVDRYLPKMIDESIPPSKGYIWPAKGVFTSGYGPRWGRMHRGIDVAAPVGTPIHAAADGVVISAGWNRGGYGNLVDIRHPDGTVTRYAHNSKLVVTKGQEVHQGQQISLMGSTGFSTGPHLHFEIRKGGTEAVNPIAFLPPR